MPHYQIITHADNQEASFSDVADEKSFADGQLPDNTRPSSTDAVLMAELQAVLSANAGFKAPGFQDHLDSLFFLYKISFAFKMWEGFKVEVAPLLLAIHNQTEVTKEIYKIIHSQMSGFSNANVADKILQRMADKLNQDMKVRKQQLAENIKTPTYPEFLLGGQATEYFKKLKITPEYKEAPQDALIQNVRDSATKDPMPHVRHCEDVGCTLNPNDSPAAKAIIESIPAQILEVVGRLGIDKDKTIFYGGFASGLLLRDLHNVKALIEAGYKNIKLLFVDKSYANLIKLGQDTANLSIEEQISVKMQLAALKEFSSWVAAHTSNDANNPLSIHLFSEAEEAKTFLESQNQKLDVLVAEDFFVKGGTAIPAIQTPEAHADFMALAKSALDKNGCFFELIKNDIEEKIFLHMGLVDKNKYTPLATRVYEARQNQLKNYIGTSLGFFTKENDSPVRDEKGAIVKPSEILPRKKS